MYDIVHDIVLSVYYC